MKEQKFFRCRHCGNLIEMLHDSGVKIKCCGEDMGELIPNTVEAATEKHVPVATQNGNTVVVKIGDVEHPMEEKHYIEWIYIQTEGGGQRKNLKPGEKPVAEFELKNDKLVAVFAYCNIHGLWKKV
ncbi:MAG: desulfoferrodoxin family protein [Treponemataceae bacterium]